MEFKSEESARNPEKTRRRRIIVILVVVAVVVVVAVTVGLVVHFVTQKDGDEKQDYGIKGDCWVASQCDSCNKDYTGNMDGVKVCCVNCERSGLQMYFSDDSNYCKCLHNGPD